MIAGAATASVALLLAVSLGLGVRCSVLSDDPLDSPLLRAVADLLVGLGILATALLVAGAAFGVSAASVWGVVAVAAAAAASSLRATVTLVRRASREWAQTAGLAGTAGLLAMALTLWLSGAAPPVDFDSLMYHLRGPELFLRAGRFYAPEGNQHIAFVGALHTLYLPFLLLREPAAAALLQGSLLLAATAAGVVATDRWFGLRAGWVIPVLMFGGPMLLRVGSVAMVDAGTMAYAVVGHILLLASHRRSHDDLRLQLAAGIVLGVAIGSKVLATAYVAAALAGVGVALPWTPTRVLAWRKSAAALALGVTLAAAPWLARTAVLYGSPLYPYVGGATLPGWAQQVEPPLDLPSGPSTLRAVRLPFSLGAWIRSPERLTPEGDGHLYGLNPAFAAIALALVLSMRARFLPLLIPPLLYVVAVVWWSRYLNLRYFVPIYLPLTMAAAAAWLGVASAVKRHARIAIGTAAVLAIAAIAVPVRALVLELRLSERPQAALGLIDVDAYLARHDEIAGLRSYLNAALPEDARVLFLFEARAFGVRQAVIQDNLMENWRIIRPRVADGRCLDGFGFTHVVFGQRTLEYFRARGLDDAHLDRAGLNAFLANCLEGGMGDRMHTVFSVRGGPPPS